MSTFTRSSRGFGSSAEYQLAFPRIMVKGGKNEKYIEQGRVSLEPKLEPSQGGGVETNETRNCGIKIRVGNHLCH